MLQDKVFLAGEGDRWFERNKTALAHSDNSSDPILRMLDLTKLQPSDVIEIGASNGYRLHEIYERYQCCVTAVEPSLQAIEDGKTKYPEISFVQGVASSLQVDSEGRFDLAVINFVLHWIDRSALLRSVAEIDRVLKDGGHLIIGDFYPSNPQKVAYHHLPDKDVWTYKQSYQEIFLSSNLYEIAASYSYAHDTHEISTEVEPANRAQVILLKKDLNARYHTVHLK